MQRLGPPRPRGLLQPHPPPWGPPASDGRGSSFPAPDWPYDRGVSGTRLEDIEVRVLVDGVWIDPVDIAAVVALGLLANDWTGRHVRAVHGPADLTWPEAAVALSSGTCMSIEAQQISDDEERAALRGAGMSEVAVEGIIGMAVGEREGFTLLQPRSVLSTTPCSVASCGVIHYVRRYSPPNAKLWTDSTASQAQPAHRNVRTLNAEMVIDECHHLLSPADWPAPQERRLTAWKRDRGQG